MSRLMSKYDVSERTVRKWISKLGFTNNSHILNKEVRAAKQQKQYTKKYILVTWAQNATPVHKEFWDNMVAYADHIDADIAVIQGRFQNPTSVWTSNMENDEWWDNEFTIKDEDGNIVHTYLDCSRQEVHANIDILADIKIRPTAANPLRGFEGVSGDKTSIIGHPRVHLKSLPVLNGHKHKLLLTTGACTLKNYSDTREGKVGEFHHTYGFVVIENKDDKTSFIRQVTAKSDGSFIDLNKSVASNNVEKIKDCAAFIMGDIHVSQVHKPVVDKTLELFKKVKPEYVVLHDLFNGESINHHEANDPIKSYHKLQEGKNLLKNEIDGMYKWLDDNSIMEYKVVVPFANHHQWSDKWVSFSDWKKDVPNSKEYMELALASLNGETPKGIIAYLLNKRYENITCLGADESFKVNDWELGQHGHLGAHGSKGSTQQNRRLNTKIIVGDYHQPERLDNAISAGTYTQLRMGYNTGASAWMHCGVMVHNNGKAQQILFFNDEFTTLL